MASVSRPLSARLIAAMLHADSVDPGPLGITGMLASFAVIAVNWSGVRVLIFLVLVGVGGVRR